MNRGPLAAEGHPHDDDAPPLAPEDAEWADELAAAWVEVYKKSATTLALLRLVRDHGPVSAQNIAVIFTETTGWTLTERGLYRTLRRLAQAGSLTISRVEVLRTGAKRQDFSLTVVGRAYLQRIEDQLLH